MARRVLFVSPYLNRRLRTVEEVMRARRLQAAWSESSAAELQVETESPCRLIYSRLQESVAKASSAQSR